MECLECHQPLCEELPRVDVVGSWAGRVERLSSESPDTRPAETNNKLLLSYTHINPS